MFIREFFWQNFLTHCVILCIMKRVSWPPNHLSSGSKYAICGASRCCAPVYLAALRRWERLALNTRGDVPSIHLIATVFMHHPGAPSSSPIELCVYQVACVLAHSLCKIYITPVTKGTFARWACLAFRLAHSSWPINTCLNDPYSTNLAPPVSVLARSAFCRQYRGRLARLPSPQPPIVRPPDYLQDTTRKPDKWPV